MTELDDAMRQLLTKREEAHKYSYGHAVVLSGGSGQGGAARMAARAALRVGAGLVTILAPQSSFAEHAAQLNAVMLAVLPDGYALRGLLTRDPRINAVLLGPNLGLARAREMVPEALHTGRATVLDADALSAFAPEPQDLFDAISTPNVVMTPHLGEFGRLFPDLAQQIKDGTLPHVDAATAAAKRSGATILLKGAQTVIAAPDGQVAINHATGPNAAPWLATAGAGDVLAGLITGLLARGATPFLAARTGAWLHTQAARQFGPGLIAEDLPDTLPQVFRNFGL